MALVKQSFGIALAGAQNTASGAGRVVKEWAGNEAWHLERWQTSGEQLLRGPPNANFADMGI